MEYQGKIVIIKDVEEINAQFKKLIFKIDDCNVFNPQVIEFQLANRSMDLIQPFKVGDLVTVHFKMSSKEWSDKVGKRRSFITLHAYKIEHLVDNAKLNPVDSSASN